MLHALKKASAPWRLSAALDDGSRGILAATNNFLLLVRQTYRGHLSYPMALLNSRLFNRLYTEHFPGVNIEAFTLGLLPFPWPPQKGERPPPKGLELAEWLAWARGDDEETRGSLTYAVYEWLVDAGCRLNGCGAVDHDLDRRVEAVVCGLLGLSMGILDELLADYSGIGRG